MYEQWYGRGSMMVGWGKRLFVVGAWVSLVIAIMSWVGVGMEVVVREHAGNSQDGLAI